MTNRSHELHCSRITDQSTPGLSKAVNTSYRGAHAFYYRALVL